MTAFVQGEVRAEVIHELRNRAGAGAGADVPALVEFLTSHLELLNGQSLLPVLSYFRAAFDLSLREALPLREWLGGKDRSEVDTILVPAMQRNKARWEMNRLQPA